MHFSDALQYCKQVEKTTWIIKHSFPQPWVSLARFNPTINNKGLKNLRIYFLQVGQFLWSINYSNCSSLDPRSLGTVRSTPVPPRYVRPCFTFFRWFKPAGFQPHLVNSTALLFPVSGLGVFHSSLRMPRSWFQTKEVHGVSLETSKIHHPILVAQKIDWVMKKKTCTFSMKSWLFNRDP